MRAPIRSAAFSLFLSLSVSTSACVIVLGPGDGSDGGSSSGSSGAGQATTSILPKPENTQRDPSTLTPAQQARLEEVERYNAENLYKGLKILRTVEDPNGDIIDWVAPESMTQLPYEPPVLPWSIDQLVLPDGVELAQSELEKYPELFGPVGSTPIHRPMYWGYVLSETGATSIQDYLDNYRDAGQAGAPANRRYAGMLVDTPNRGVTGFMNQFAPQVEDDSFSLMEFAVTCLGAPGESVEEELVGIVLSLDKHDGFWVPDGKSWSVHKDDLVRLHVESYRIVNGVKDAAWDTDKLRFVQNPGNIRYPLDSVVPVSTPGALPEGKPVEHLPAIFQAPNGDWWLSYNGWLLGYYPASLFTLLNKDKGACQANWYLEVLDKKLGTAWVETKMGTGTFGDTAAPGEAPWVRRPMYWDTNYFLVEPTDGYQIPEVAECYTRSKLIDLGPELGKMFLAGGPGGYNPLCTK